MGSSSTTTFQVGMRACAGSVAIVLSLGLTATAQSVPKPLATAIDVAACGRKAASVPAMMGFEIHLERVPAQGHTLGRPSRVQMLFAFPDTFRETNTYTLSGTELVQESGFAKGRPFVSTRSNNPDTVAADTTNDAMFLRLRQTFARFSLILLWRETPVVPITWKPAVERAGNVMKIAATGPDDFNIEFMVAADTCRLVAATWRRPTNFGDARGGRTTTDGRQLTRYEFFDYRRFEGMWLPARMRTSTDGIARFDERIVAVRVNPPGGGR